MSDFARVVVVEKWPDIPGHAAKAMMWSAKRRSKSADGRYWEVRSRFGRWHWRPVRGMFVSMFEVER